ncbi:helix-turn-helix transcriptional regulator [Actinomadura kijaniata]|uniref:helix-turn-helix transcriptional regulator n=1 Tax=Actinomadura kijaniata TaxID=46161 RepID=UPI0008339FA7|nr:helix-turn-helix transcriptional regulator [Actinomadura kijaniata]
MRLSAHDHAQIRALLGKARHEILLLAPSWAPALHSACALPPLTAPRTRVVVSRSFLAQAPSLTGRHVQVRLGGATPLLLVVDRRSALSRHADDRSVHAPVHRHTEVERLVHVFEHHWKRASPVVPAGEAPLTDLQRSIIRSLAMGMTDKATAGALQISTRTVQRQVSQLMQQWGIQSRLELGVHLAATGLVPTRGPAPEARTGSTLVASLSGA